MIRLWVSWGHEGGVCRCARARAKLVERCGPGIVSDAAPSQTSPVPPHSAPSSLTLIGAGDRSPYPNAFWTFCMTTRCAGSV
eukprot:scaffold7021_cov120-Isochrysis_galbana.AAC.4